VFTLAFIIVSSFSPKLPLFSLPLIRQSMMNKRLVAYVSDLEGNYDYWINYLSISKVLTRLPNGEVDFQHKDRVNPKVPKDHFIHGGDACDRWKGDIRILRDLLSLKKRYPENVHFLLGNRDVNKLRLPVSLHPVILEFLPHAYWAPANSVEANFPLRDPVAKLKWVLKNTMGAPFAFECRREELKEMNLPASDEDIYTSFTQSVFPEAGGELLEYLSYGKMSVIIEDTIYVHGGITKFGLG
jgi:hypothetical protein